MSKQSSEKPDARIVLIAAIRLISSVTSGFTLFCAPVHFMETAGLSGAVVGAGLGVAGLASIAGRVLGGALSDAAVMTKRTVLLISLALMAVGCGVMSAGASFWLFVAGTLLMALGFGMFAPAADAMISEISKPELLRPMYAYNRVANWVGLAIGLLLGGVLLNLTQSYLLLFQGCAVLFFATFLLSLRKLTNVESARSDEVGLSEKLSSARKDSKFYLFLGLNFSFQFNSLLVMTVIPLYLIRCLERDFGTSTNNQMIILAQFAFYVTLCAISQIPIYSLVSKWSDSKVLSLSSLFWSAAFLVLWAAGAGVWSSATAPVIVVALMVLASTLYGPAASSQTIAMAPENARALYLSASSLCWSLARLVAPALGLMLTDSSLNLASVLWFGLAAVNILLILPGLYLIEKHTEKGEKTDIGAINGMPMQPQLISISQRTSTTLLPRQRDL